MHPTQITSRLKIQVLGGLWVLRRRSFFGAWASVAILLRHAKSSAAFVSACRVIMVPAGEDEDAPKASTHRASAADCKRFMTPLVGGPSGPFAFKNLAQPMMLEPSIKENTEYTLTSILDLYII